MSEMINNVVNDNCLNNAQQIKINFYFKVKVRNLNMLLVPLSLSVI